MITIETNINIDFYNKVIQLHNIARKSVIQTVNQTMVQSYFLIGKMIIEVEQQGKNRADYGKHLLKEL